jgi:membrane protease YdiL (CAAX protease family)
VTLSEPRRRSPGTFFLLTFGLSVPFWLVAALAKRLSIGLPFNIPVSIFMVVCPLVAALILVFREEGSRGIRRLLGRVFDHRGIKPNLWYVPVALLVPLIFLLSYAVLLLTGRSLPELDFPLLALPAALALFFVLAACEEAGWMGYAFDPMHEQWNALAAAVVLGVVWSLWHIPADPSTGNGLDFIAWQRIYAVALRVLIVWAYSNTGKSVLAAVIMHATDNVSFALFPNFGSHYDPAVVAPITIAAAALVTYLWGPKSLAAFRFARPGKLRRTVQGG